MMRDMQRKNWPDIAKGFGIVLVVYGHIARGLFNAEIPMDIAWYERLDELIYTFHMPLFFWISGYLYFFSIEKKNSLAVLKEKFKTIAYLYIIWSLLHGLIEVLMSNYTNGSLSLKDVLMLWQPRAHFWFLYVLFFIFAMSTLVYKSSSHKIRFIGLLLSMALYQYPDAVNNIDLLLVISPWMVYFAAGVAMAKFMPMLFSKPGSILVILLLILALITKQKLAEASLGISVILLLSNYIDLCGMHKIKNALRYLGQWSLPIYLMHVLSASGARIILQKFFYIENLWVHLVVGMFFGLIAPILFHRLTVLYRLSFFWEFPRLQLIVRKLPF